MLENEGRHCRDRQPYRWQVAVAKLNCIRISQSWLAQSAQSMARDLGPSGHIAVVIIDGIIDLERTRARLPDKPDSFYAGQFDRRYVYMLTEQERSAWTFELDLRPFGEHW